MKLSPDELVDQLKTYHEGLSKEAHKWKDEGMSLPLPFTIQTLRLWKEEVRKYLEDSGASDYALVFSKVELPQHDLLEELHQSIDDHLGKLDEIINEVSPRTNAAPGETTGSGKRVFVVHGRDTTNLFELITLLEQRYGLTCINVAREPDERRPAIEQFKQEAKDVSFAFALIAPYDLVKVEGRNEYVQAGANVVFELGWFCALLGTQKVCILRKKGVTIHPDLDGIARIGFDASVTEKVEEIEAKLKAAGLI